MKLNQYPVTTLHLAISHVHRVATVPGSAVASAAGQSLPINDLWIRLVYEQKLSFRLTSAIYALQRRGLIAPDSICVEPGLGYNVLQLKVLAPQLCRQLCVFTVQQAVTILLLASQEGAIRGWAQLLLAYVTSVPNYQGFIQHVEAPLKKFQALNETAQQLVSVLALWRILGYHGKEVDADMSVCLSAPIPASTSALQHGVSELRRLVSAGLLSVGDVLDDVEERIRVIPHKEGHVICLLHASNVIKAADAITVALRDVAVLVFGSGFGRSCGRALQLMCFGLGGATVFPNAPLSSPLLLFPHPIAWYQYKAARGWQCKVRQAIATCKAEDSPWPLKACVAHVLHKPEGRAGEGKGGDRRPTHAGDGTAFRWRMSAKRQEGRGGHEQWGPAPFPTLPVDAVVDYENKYSYTLPFGSPPFRPLPPPRGTCMNQQVYASPFIQFRCNPVVLYAAGLLEAALAYQQRGVELERSHKDSSSLEGGTTYWEGIRLEHLRQEMGTAINTINVEAGVPRPRRASDELGTDPKALYLESARILYFLTRLQDAPTFADELVHMGYAYFPPSPSPREGDATTAREEDAEIVPGPGGGVASLSPVIWEELVTSVSGLGSEELLTVIGKEAVSFFNAHGHIQRTMAVCALLQAKCKTRIQTVGEEGRGGEGRGEGLGLSDRWTSPLTRTTGDAASIKEIGIKCPRWPAKVITWSPNTQASASEEMGVRVEAVTERSQSTDDACVVPEAPRGTVTDDGKMVFSRGRSHVYHVGSGGRPCSVEEVVLQAFTLQEDVMAWLTGTHNTDMFVDAAGVVRFMSQVTGVKRARSYIAERANIITFPDRDVDLRSLAPGLYGHPAALKQMFFMQAHIPSVTAACGVGYVPPDMAAMYCSGVDFTSHFNVDTLVGLMTPQLTSYSGETPGWRGTHGENVLWGTLFGLLMWEAIYAVEPPDPAASNALRSRLRVAWKHPWQTVPLDMWAADFYAARADDFNVHVRRLERMSPCELAAYLHHAYTTHVGMIGFRVRWDLFSVDDMCELVHAAGATAICCVLRHMMQSQHVIFTGLPDVTLWKPHPCTSCRFGVSGGCQFEVYCADGQLRWRPALQSSFTPDANVIVESWMTARRKEYQRSEHFAMLEVKSTKDRVQVHQLAWFHRLTAKIHVAVAHVLEDASRNAPVG